MVIGSPVTELSMVTDQDANVSDLAYHPSSSEFNLLVHGGSVHSQADKTDEPNPLLAFTSTDCTAVSTHILHCRVLSSTLRG